ncbi:hypothetical protein Btoyo_2761 [Bacillus toyonensis BCT-7112]|nr:hypothetical protein Btoyo_2761 [Bacillus toyonensis BCT-7112]EEL25143.1 tRNA(Ile)-lysidine synthase [Bacillus cereus Rock1-3]EEL36629.1 tRNA(Ile)-lysidine synthase [Bacillus cereus Rock3-28]
MRSPFSLERIRSGYDISLYLATNTVSFMLLGISSLTSITSSSPFDSVIVPGTDKSCEKGETISCLNPKLHSSYVRTIFKSPGKSSEPEGCVRLKNSITLSICIEEREDGILYS